MRDTEKVYDIVPISAIIIIRLPSLYIKEGQITNLSGTHKRTRLYQKRASE